MIITFLVDFFSSLRGDWANRNASYDNSEDELVSRSPIANLFLRSWRNNAFNRESTEKQIFVSALMFLQLYLGLSSTVFDHAPLSLNMALISFTLASG